MESITGDAGPDKRKTATDRVYRLAEKVTDR